jgi:hypothetical protein
MHKKGLHFFQKQLLPFFSVLKKTKYNLNAHLRQKNKLFMQINNTYKLYKIKRIRREVGRRGSIN